LSITVRRLQTRAGHPNFIRTLRNNFPKRRAIPGIHYKLLDPTPKLKIDILLGFVAGNSI
jgi:hypothetical protein